jgi:hypothetical protein
LVDLIIPKVISIGERGLSCCSKLETIDAPQLKTIGKNLLFSSHKIKTFYAPNLKVLDFMCDKC